MNENGEMETRDTNIALKLGGAVGNAKGAGWPDEQVRLAVEAALITVKLIEESGT